MSEARRVKKRVCVIDDDEDIREAYLLKLNLEGFEVVTAENGAVGLERIRETKPDIILLDLMMPVKSGLDVLKELEADAALSKIPVVVLSNIDNEDAFKEVGEHNTRFYLVKSLTTLQKATDIIREVLR